jgi:hydrogenase/urease accessory protein HupE
MATRAPLRRALTGAALGAGQAFGLGALLLLTSASGAADPRRGSSRPSLVLGFGRAVAAGCLLTVIAAGGLAAWRSGLSVFWSVLAAWVATIALGAGLGLAAGWQGWWDWID